jgi:uncharacterized protein (TIGR03086 family)
MTEISERYARLSDAFAAKIVAVPADRWTSPSPCPEWNAHEVVNHVVSTQNMILGLAGRTTGDIPSATDDPLAAFNAARAVVRRDLDDPAVAGIEFEGFMGKMTLEAAVDRFLNFDLVVHGWDLARAAGLDDRIDPDDLARVDAAAHAFGDQMRGPGAFGPEIEPQAGADEQTRVLAFLGRG